jgi:cephalosporin hydroxylase
MIATQEVIYQVKPDLIIETGVAHGGSLIFSASMLTLLGNNGSVLGIDIDIRKHNREAIEAHEMRKRIHLIQGSSISSEVLNEVKKYTDGKKVMVFLDSNHTYEHVKAELELYSPFVKKGSYLIVYDTAIDDLPDSLSSDRPWGYNNGPKKAVHEFLKVNSRFEVDQEINNKLVISVAPDGYLKCLKD